MSKAPAIIVDLDGTLSNCDHRRHHVEKRPKDFEKFYGGISGDKPNRWCVELVRWAILRPVAVLFVSGRPEKYREVSMGQIESHLDSSGYMIHLFMRRDGDFRRDDVVKEELYRRHIEPDYDVLFCVDDRGQVVDMWRRIGLTCLQCAPGDF